MRTAILLGSLLLFSAQCAVSQVVNQRLIDSDGYEHLLGPLTEEGLSSPPFGEWFERGVDQYEPDRQIVERIDNLTDYDIEVFMGTWCSDSRREVPRLIKTLHELSFPPAQLSIIGVNRSKDQYKQSPSGEEAGKNIHRVPTIIFYKDGREVDRIVESPIVSLEQDIQTITSGGEYTPNYLAVTKLNDLLQSRGLSFVSDEAGSIADDLKPLSTKPSELATYGSVHLYRKNIDKAVAVFEINRLLFPDEAVVYASLAAAYYDQGSYGKAEANAMEALKLEPDNESALEILAAIATLDAVRQ